MIERDSSRVARLVEFPERLQIGMNTLLARQQLTTHAGMPDIAVEEDCSGNCDCSLRVVGGLAEQPLALSIARVPRNDRPWRPLESVDSAGVPLGDAVAGQVLCLLADGVAGRQSSYRCENSVQLWRQGDHRFGNTIEA